MYRQPPITTLTDTLFPYTPRFRSAEFRVPPAERLRRLIGRPAPQGGDQPAFLRHGDEFGGRDMAQFLVLPPRQRLETRDFPGLEVDERLVGQGQPALRQRRSRQDRKSTRLNSSH